MPLRWQRSERVDIAAEHNPSETQRIEARLALALDASVLHQRPAKTTPGSSFSTGRALIAAATMLTSMTITPPKTGVNHIMWKG
jgi:hypothetical protein